MTVKLGSLAVCTAIVTVAGIASAQVEAGASTGASAQAGGQAEAQPAEVTLAPAPEPAPAAQPVALEPAQTQAQVGMGLPQQDPAEDPAETDHEMMVGRVGVGYLGLRGLVMPTETATSASTTAEVLAPVVGVRYWMNPLLGLDLGLGLTAQFGSQKDTPAGGTEQSDDSDLPTVLIAHAGVPLSLGSKGHFSFQIVPELNVGYGWRTIKNPGAEDIEASDFHLDFGARAGAEVQFGFIGVPELSLQGGIGLLFATDQTSVSQAAAPPAQGDSTSKRSRTSIGTDAGSNPWNIFISNIAALYYF
ncbi:MAG: hypothetical protein JW940_27640 [Polyangiaceae bacterium]|nr:hypothetical protein [Polyangiaceae bacterium]